MLLSAKRNFFPVTTVLSTIVFILATVAMQLYWNEDKYFAMMRAKALCLIPIAIVCLITLIVWGIEYCRNRRYIERRCNFSLLDAAVALFAVSAIVTWLISPIPQKAFSGELGMRCGSFLFITGTVIYFIVSRNMRPAKWVIALLMGVWAVIFLWTILNQMGVDLFGMHQNMQPSEVRMYTASFGNTNAGSDCFCLLLPIGMIMYLYSDNTKLTGWLRLYIALGICGILFLRTEGALFGIMFIMPFLVYISFSSNEKLDRLLEIILIASLSFVLFHWYTVIYHITDLSLAMQISFYYVGEILLVLTLAVITMRRRGMLVYDAERNHAIWKWMTYSFTIAIAAIIVFFIVYSTYHPTFGTNRGAIWRGSVWAYRMYSPRELLFGEGSGVYASNLTLAFSMLTNEPTELIYATCHDSLLQVLLTQGIFGLACFVLGIVALMLCWFKDFKNMAKTEKVLNEKTMTGILSIALLCGLVCYLGSSLVESCYPHPITLFFACLGLFRSAQIRSVSHSS